ncbi:endonuclease/exonuclease/phosphatase family protein [Photobacterium sp. 1_MG-2023]|uniref:endonuclease/exonuclease/phosphatase family protein n=1 Tax=Photobacterium sp. 1_MG-2023 TaxID=3062646 RepID=UPI0026E48F88|nr:endonuclease/exonuclease/phosphatase family protein [Photobacterium sp. 1_MG-2023]MDO6707517.1 endonuclease/exonuclease/phosphatase family protein [Photobacterium sp. 1_MG-2023]
MGMEIALTLLTALLVLTTVLPVWRHPHWLVRGWDFPRLQLAVFAVVLLVVNLCFFQAWGLFVLALACLCWHLWWILPYTRLWRCEVNFAKGDDVNRRLRVITANVLTPNRRADALIKQVHAFHADVLVTLESDAWWQSQLDTLVRDMPYTLKCPLDNLYGMHVYSRFALEETSVEFLIEDDVPSMHALLVLPCGERVRMHFLHPAPPSPTENPESAERDAELILVARSVEGSTQPLIVTGDLNDVAWSATTRLFRKISGLLDPRVGRGMFNTFHADYPFMRWPLDHIFHSHHFTLHKIQRLPSIGSDHFALYTELYLEPMASQKHNGLQPEPEDETWAQEIIQEKQVNVHDVPKPGK